jgi:hypothetical protein
MSLISRPSSTSIRPPVSTRPGTIAPENLAKIPCPNLRTLVNEGWLTPDKDGLVDLKQLDGALQRLGVTAIPRLALVVGAKGATKEAVAEQFGDMATGKFNIYRLTGSNLDHAGDTQILRGGFNKDRLDWLLSYAKNGRLGMAELARAQKDARNAEPTTFRDRALGVAELTALLKVYGTKDASGAKSISTAGLTDLYQNARFPTEWRANLETNRAGAVTNTSRTGVLGLLGGVVDMAFRQIGTASGRAMMAMDMALGRDPQLNQSSAMGLGLAMCPAGPPPAAAKKQTDDAHAAALD